MEAHLLSLDDSIWSHTAPPAGHSGGTDECHFQTSGSEGTPKWVVHTRESLRLNARAVNAHFSITAADHWLLALPLNHVGGFSILVRAQESGSKVTQLVGKWNAHDFAAFEGATLASLVPAQVFDLVAQKLRVPKLMRAVLVGGGALSPEVEKAARELGWPLFKTYGMTETGSQVATQRPGGDEMAVLPIWSLETDTEAVLTIRGPALAQGYLVPNGSEWRFEPLSAQNGLRTRDRVSITKDGFLRFLGREAGTVKILGELVALAPIQAQIDALRLELGLHEGHAVVIDLPDERKEARLALAVAGMPASDADKLLSRLNAGLRAFEQIERPTLLPEIPRNELGKSQFEALRRLITQGN
jgi:O-succinylbenzoic acid--CoA ligase